MTMKTDNEPAFWWQWWTSGKIEGSRRRKNKEWRWNIVLYTAARATGSSRDQCKVYKG